MKKEILLLILINAIGLALIKVASAADSRFKVLVFNRDNKLKIERVHTNYQGTYYFKSDKKDATRYYYPDDNGNFSIVMPDLHKPYKFNIGFKGINYSIKLYAEPGDNVIMKVYLSSKVDSVSFSGAGAAKYNLILKLNQQMWGEYFPALNKIQRSNIKDSLTLILKMNELTSLMNGHTKKAEKLAQNFIISSDLRTICRSEFANYYSDWCFRLSEFFKAYPHYRSVISNYYLRKKSDLITSPSDLSLYCQIYMRTLLSRTILDLQMKTKSEVVQLVSVYDLLKNEYPSSLHDRLIDDLFFVFLTYDDNIKYTDHQRDSVINDALKIVKTPYIKGNLSEKLVIAKNFKDKLFAGVFINLDGSKVDVSKFRGKVIFIDIWFLGCAGCAAFHSIYENKIHPLFKDRKNFMFLSINIDKTKKRWIEGIKSKKYTSNDYVNVSTGDLGLEHPFMKHYGITGAPFLMIVDKDLNIRDQPLHSIMTKTEDLVNKIYQAFIIDL